jgi:hypothetical protein
LTRPVRRSARVFYLSAFAMALISLLLLLWPGVSERLYTGGMILLCIVMAAVSVRVRQLRFADRGRLARINLVLTALGATVLIRLAKLVFTRWSLAFEFASILLVLVATIALLSYSWQMLHALLEEVSSKTVENPDKRPPSGAKFLLLLIPRQHREDLIGDLEEEFHTILIPEYGLKAARRWYWWHVFISIGPLVWGKLKRVVGLVWLWKSVR